MGVALLLITHDDIGSSLFSTAVNMMGVCPIPSHNLIISEHMDINQGYEQAIQLCHELDQGDGILIVTDMFGSTPSNVAMKLIEELPEKQRVLVTGVNLPMLVRIMNYAHLDLPDLAEKACSSASDSIFVVSKPIVCD